MSTSDHAASHAQPQNAAASTCTPSPAPPGEPIGEEEARLNAVRLSLAARWRRALGEGMDSLPLPVAARDDEFFQAREASDIWHEAEHDEALLAMLREDQREVLGAEAVEPEVLEQARARFQSRMEQAARSEEAPQVLEAHGEEAALTVGEVVSALEREAERVEAERGASGWRSILEPLRASREALPAHITSNAMNAFWKGLGLSMPREVARSFNEAARLLLMGRADPGARLSLARESRPSGISQAVERLALESAVPEPPMDKEGAEDGGKAGPSAQSPSE